MAVRDDRQGKPRGQDRTQHLQQEGLVAGKGQQRAACEPDQAGQQLEIGLGLDEPLVGVEAEQFAEVPPG